VFNARIAGRPVRGRLPLRGDVFVEALAQESTAELVASPAALTTGHGVLDRVLAGPGFLNADNFPEITFRSEVLVCVPTGWRAIGNMHIKGTEHPVVCELAADLRSAHTEGAVTVTGRWVLDSRWITQQRMPTLNRRVTMACSLALNQA